MADSPRTGETSSRKISMVRDRIAADPDLARKILVADALLHFMICFPLFGRRGYPEVDPFFLAAIWLWIPPVCISAVFSQLNRRRVWDLLCFSLAAGFVISWGTILARPSYKSPFHALFGLVFHGPVTIMMVSIVELFSRAILNRIRQFVAADQSCESCGYSLYGLVEPRCPECGTSFHRDQLLPDYSPRETPLLRRKTSYGIVVLCVLAAALPIAYRQTEFEEKRRAGRLQAEADWKNGRPIWYIRETELASLSARQQEVAIAAMDQFDPAIGFKVEYMWSFWQKEEYERAYRTVIEEKLKAAGRGPPTFGPL